MPKISIIVPVYKVEKYIEQCIESILNQTFKDFELILVDDGSPDKCPEICDKYALKDERIKVIHQKNRGLSAARNTGIDVSSGDYLCFIDSDDLIASEYCQQLYNLLENNDYDFSVCGMYRFRDEYESFPRVFNLESKVWNSNEFLKEQLNRRSEFGACNKLYRRSIFSKIRFVEGRLNEDVIWSGDLSINTMKCIETKSQYYCYRQRSNGIVGKQSKKGSLDFLYASNYLINISQTFHPDMIEDCLYYSLSYTWNFIDKIYVQCSFRDNYLYLVTLQKMLRKYRNLYKEMEQFSKIQKYRMNLFSSSKILYGLNAYLRLIRVYLFRIIHKGPYKNNHGI